MLPGVRRDAVVSERLPAKRYGAANLAMALD